MSENKLENNPESIAKWIIPREDEILIPEKPTRVYERKAVGVIDLLGITDKVNSIKDEPGAEQTILDEMNKIIEIAKDAARLYDGDFNFLYLSDTFVYVTDEKNILNFLMLFANLQTRIFLETRTLLRGAIEIGQVQTLDSNKQIFGPAYISAYLRQEKVANYPRIIVRKETVDKIKQEDLSDDLILVSSDREHYINYIVHSQEYKVRGKNNVIREFKRKNLFRYLIDQMNRKDTNDNVRSKYGWTISYLSSIGVWPNEKKYQDWEKSTRNNHCRII